MPGLARNVQPVEDADPTEDLTPTLYSEVACPEDLEDKAVRRYTKGILFVVRARRRLFGTAGLAGVTVEKALAADSTMAALRPDDLPQHVRHDFLRLTFLGRFLQDAPTEADLKDYASTLFRLTERLEEFLEQAFG